MAKHESRQISKAQVEWGTKSPAPKGGLPQSGHSVTNAAVKLPEPLL